MAGAARNVERRPLRPGRLRADGAQGREAPGAQCRRRTTSSHNSGVVHAGIYYPRGWLKTRLCIEGNGLLYEWADRHGVRAQRTGKLIIATRPSQLEALDALYQSARDNGVPALELLSGTRVKGLEPHVVAVSAIFSASSGVIDQMELMRSFAQAARERGAVFAYKHALVAAERESDGFLVRVTGPDGAVMDVQASSFINCSGLAADGIAALLGYPLDGTGTVPRLRQTVNKGRYYDIVDREKAGHLQHLVYPLPHADRSGLGVHVTLDIDGGVHLGPDTEWLGTGATLDYLADDSRRVAFVEAVSEYLPWLTVDDIAPGHVGYRAKLHDPGAGPCDFLIWQDKGYVHLGGIESPGMTASIAIAREVSRLVGK